jgi:hypothetical protein
MFKLITKEQALIRERESYKTGILRILFLILARRISIGYGWYILTADVEVYLFLDNSETTQNELYLTKSDGLKLISEGVFLTVTGHLINLSVYDITFNQNKHYNVKNLVKL